ncbi:biotin--[acetyl-CoA-carboxylase] ligase [Mycoplasma sp. P36-A1]|uniref:biotin--[acetyl-CoA-carboxylase] ligase n=1 Tax=Mycoplasma sp. P36-A1 TaxID=3252900 RepID=UPI003C2E3BBF
MSININKLRQLVNNKIEIEYFETIDSTQTYLLNNKTNNYKVVLGSYQTAGYGTRNRVYYSSKDLGVYFSINMPANNTKYNITLSSAAIVCDVLQRYSNKDIKIKWYNDIYSNNKKAVGILAQTITDSNNKIENYVLGIGINLYNPNNDVTFKLKNQVGYLFDNKTLALEEILSIIINRIYFDYQSNISNIELYNQNLLFKNKNILIKTSINPKKVKVLKVEEDGRLVVKENNKIIKYFREQVELLAIEGE